MNEVATMVIAGVVTILGGAASATIVQVVAARRKTSAEATKLNAEVDADKFDRVTAALFRQVEDLRAEVDDLKDENARRAAREWVYASYAQDLRDHIYSGKAPPPPAWPAELSLTGRVASPASAPRD